MGIEQDPAGAGSSAAASAATAAASYPPNQPPPSATPAQQQYPPAMQQQTYPPAPQGFSSPQGYGAPQGVPPHQHNYGNPPNYYAQQQPQPLPQVLPTVVTGRPPIVSIISPDDMKKIRKMQWINFGCTMVQLVCSLAIILMVRNNLSRITRGERGGRVLQALTSHMAGQQQAADPTGLCRSAHFAFAIKQQSGPLVALGRLLNQPLPVADCGVCAFCWGYMY